MRPSSEQRRRIRADLHKHVDLALDLLPAMQDLSAAMKAPHRDSTLQAIDMFNLGRATAAASGDEIRLARTARSGIARPAEDIALRGNPARDWIRAIDKCLADLVRLTNEAVASIGEPLAACAKCHQPIAGTPKKANGDSYHNACYLKIRRERA